TMVQNKFMPATRPEFSPRSLIRMVTKHKLALIVTFLSLAAVTTLITMKLPATYRAEALILVDSQKIPEKYVASSVGNDLQDRLATISQTILSTDRLTSI